jgi:hypothetical protein
MADRPNYKIKRRIGSGGMSTVYLAHDTRLDRDVAVKVLKMWDGRGTSTISSWNTWMGPLSGIS